MCALKKYSFIQIHLKPKGIYLHADREFPDQSDCVAATKQLPCINWWEFLHPKQHKHIRNNNNRLQPTEVCLSSFYFNLP